MSSSPPNKLFDGQKGYPTPNSPTSGEGCRTFYLPDDEEYFALLMGAIYTLINPYNWYQNGDMTAEEASAFWQDVIDRAYQDALETSCVLAPPFWNDPEGDDAANGEDNPEFPFYEDAAVFAIAGFVLYAAGIGAALQFWTVQRQFRVALRQSDIGGIISIFMDGDLVTEVDTYAAGAPDLIYVDVVNPSTVLRLEVTGKNAAVMGEPVTEIIRKRLSAAELLPPNTRYNEDCECVEITFDGETWIENPQSDPRYGCGFNAPPLVGEDAKCLASARMVGVIRDQVDAAIDAGTAIGLVTALLAIVTALIPIVNIVVNVFVAVANALIVLGSAAISESFTEEAYEQLLCVFYENIGDDGQVNQSQLDAIIDQIEIEFPPTGAVIPVMQLLAQTLGTVGFSNAGALREETGDCTECLDICPIWIFDGTAAGWAYDPDQGLGAFFQTETGLRVDHSFYDVWAGGSRTALVVPVGCTLTGINFTTEGTLGYAPDGHVEAYLGTSRSESDAMLLYTNEVSAGVHSYGRTIVGSGQTIYFGLGAIDNNTSARITRAEVEFEGEKPIFTGGSECEE